ncbi:hypothetical protein [Thiopseudomonas acetoxidans]|uniref:Uncharacterized protein n=1 Tax=Thiopseudomonas acetoxidans TaxID=3041622 RepID=A0ABT7SNE3_9GAMM|nr:hypothetical protein [Thiopseudomonas sp. CY1220]MDM7857707.1 hypothetical protein [Thiopseudomonas sp. CY1220]
MNKNISLIRYLTEIMRQVDGKVLLLIMVFSVFMLVDIVLGVGLIPMRWREDFGKALVLILFSPLLCFLIITVMRLFPFASKPCSAWFRAGACIYFFITINF